MRQTWGTPTLTLCMWKFQLNRFLLGTAAWLWVAAASLDQFLCYCIWIYCLILKTSHEVGSSYSPYVSRAGIHICMVAETSGIVNTNSKWACLPLSHSHVARRMTMHFKGCILPGDHHPLTDCPTLWLPDFGAVVALQTLSRGTLVPPLWQAKCLHIFVSWILQCLQSL